jgi:hypothetical protein
MPDSIVARSRMADIEDAIGVRPIEEVLAERDAVVDEMADLWARYGPGGTWGDHRKSELSAIKMRLRAEYQRDKSQKVTDGYLEDAGHADPGYMALITEATQDRARLKLMEKRLDSIEHAIQRANSVVHYRASEVRLAR